MLHLSHSQRLKCAVLWQSREGVPSQGQIPDTFLSPESPNGVVFDTFFFCFWVGGFPKLDFKESLLLPFPL